MNIEVNGKNLIASTLEGKSGTATQQLLFTIAR